MATRWGIVSAGNISFDLVNAMQLLPDSEHQAVAVAARNLDRAKEFAAKFNIPNAYGSYEELARATNIGDVNLTLKMGNAKKIVFTYQRLFNCIYIGSIHTQHCALSELFINAGKNVLCEKPMSMNIKQCQKILSLAKKQNVFYLEGFWSRFFPIYTDLQRELDSGCIGQVRILQVNFGFKVMGATDRERLINKALGGGTLLDIGCYNIMMAQMVFKGEEPLKITSTCCLNKDAVDESVVTTLIFSENRLAILTCSFTCDLDQTASIYGTNGCIKLENFSHPERMSTPLRTYEYPLPAAALPMIHQRSEGLIYQIQEVRECLLKGHKQSSKMTHGESLQICKIVDEIRKQCGIVYDEDIL